MRVAHLLLPAVSHLPQHDLTRPGRTSPTPWASPAYPSRAAQSRIAGIDRIVVMKTLSRTRVSDWRYRIA